MIEAGYHEFAPPPEVADVVRCIWRYRSDGAESEPQHIAPDGCPEAILHLGVPYWELAPAGEVQQPPILFAGQITEPLVLQARSAADVVGVRFKPDGARAFFGAPMSGATNKRLDLCELHGERAASLLDAVRGPSADPLSIVNAYVVDTIMSAQLRFDPRVRSAVLELEEARSLRSEWASSERQSQRLFAEWVGVSPRMLASIFRFRRVFNAVQEKTDWVEAALQAGYFDQPQMVRDFRRFLGCTPRAWAMAQAGLSKGLASGGRVSG